MLRTFLALAALQSVSEARKRRRGRGGSAQAWCYYFDYYSYSYVYYECPTDDSPIDESVPDNNCTERGYLYSERRWDLYEIQSAIDLACPDGPIMEITAGPPALVPPPAGKPATTLPLGKEPVSPQPKRGAV